MLRVVCAVLLALALVGGPLPTNAQDAPDVTADLVFTQVYPHGDVIRFLAYIRNPHDYTVAGVRTRWEAYAADGSIVGSRTKTQPPILGGISMPYVGGAGSLNLTGKPVAVAVYLESPGQRTDALPRIFPIEGVSIGPAYKALSTKNEYRLGATITTDSETVGRDDVVTSLILRGADGQIVGADFLSVEKAPDVLAPLARIRVEEVVTTVAPASSAEVFAYVDLP